MWQKYQCRRAVSNIQYSFHYSAATHSTVSSITGIKYAMKKSQIL